MPLLVTQVIALAAAAAAISERYRAMVIVQAGLGLRLGELLGLRVCDVDFLRRTVTIEHQSHAVHRSLVPPKTESSRRTIPLPQVVADALAAHLAAYPASADTGCACPDGVKCSRSRSGLIFHTEQGRPVDHDYYGRRIFGKAIARANAEHAAAIPTDTSTHDLRHHFASVLLAAGESVIAVAEWLGHDSATLVLTTYGHLMPQSDDRMRKAVDGAWSTVTTDSCAPTVPSRAAKTS